MEEPGKRNLKVKGKSGFMPDKLKSAKLDDLIHSVTVLFNKVKTAENQKDQHTTERIVKTLVRGLGSSNVQVQKNYFAALVSLITSNKMLPEFSAKCIHDAVETELHISGNIAKGEEGEILMGRVLVFGALVRSGALGAASAEDQATVVRQLLQDIKGKSYLPLAADPFLIDYLKQVKEKVFKKSVWPVLQEEVAPGPAQSLLVYHMLLFCEERFPSVVSPKFLKEALTVPKVLSIETVSPLLSALKADFKVNATNYPVHSDIFKHLCHTEEEVLLRFWEEVDTQLLTNVPTSNRQIMAVKFFSYIVLHLEHSSQALKLLTQKMMALFMKRNKASGYFQKIMNSSCKEALDNLYKLTTKSEDFKTLLCIIKKLLFEPGNVLFEQLSGIKIVQQLMTQLKEKGVKKLAVLLQQVVTGSSSTVDHRDNEAVSRPWHNKERLQATHLFCKLLSLQTMKTNFEWRLEQLTFLFDMGFFTASNIGVELASLIRDSFFSCLNHRLPNLVELRNILAGIVEHINKRLESGDQLRVKISSEVIPAWKKMYATAKLVGASKGGKHELWVPAVFQTMFYHIGLHLFKEATFATDVLQELHSVYERVGISNGASSEEPHWSEVVVEMFLSLLSRNSQLHRHLIGCIFTHFCPVMNPQNIHQILQVLDPSTDTNPLLDNADDNSESSSGEEDSDEEVDEDDQLESSDDGMTDIEEDVEEDKVNDKLRRAVIDALGDAGATTDVESLDLEDMDEVEAARVDKALSQAFKVIKPNKNKKQPSHAKALTHFRIRVLDLIEVWISSEPPLDLMVDTLLRLVSLLEFSIVDRHQAPLETRLRNVIKKLTSIKKYKLSDCKDLHLGNILKSLLEKGNRTTTVYMSISKELTACTMFITRSSQQVINTESSDGQHLTVLAVLNEFVKSFFLQRDCLFTAALFEGLFKLNVPVIADLACKLPNYAFDPNVHPFRRSKAVEFLIMFWKNNRILQEVDEKFCDQLRKMSKRLYKGCLKMIEDPVGRVQPKYILLLRRAFETIKQKKWLNDVEWSNFFQSLTEFQKVHASKLKKEHKSNGQEPMEVDESISVLGNEEGNHPTLTELELESVTDQEQSSSANNESELSPLQKNKSVSKKKRKSECLVEDKKDELVQENEEEMDVKDAESELEESAQEKSLKKLNKKRSREKLKRTQLLKNSSKKLRLESMSAGLEENLFSNYNVLSNSIVSPER